MIATAFLLSIVRHAGHHPEQLPVTQTGAQSWLMWCGDRRSTARSTPQVLLLLLVFLPHFVDTSDTPVAVRQAVLGGILAHELPSRLAHNQTLTN